MNTAKTYQSYVGFYVLNKLMYVKINLCQVGKYANGRIFVENKYNYQASIDED